MKIRKKYFYFVFIVVLISVLFFWFKGGDVAGRVISDIEINKSFKVSKISFDASDGIKIFGLWFRPFLESYDMIIVLPGAGGTKESRRTYADFLLEREYGVLVLDQRGIGESISDVNSFEEDFQAYLNKKDVFQYMMADDVIRAVDFLEGQREVGKVAVLGESMGGRNAIIAAGMDERIKGVIIISSAGYHFSSPDLEANSFISHINPDSYIGRISPRRILFLHSIYDNVISIDEARVSFELAKEPKNFIEIDEEGCSHGYCKSMEEHVFNELEKIF